MVKLHEAAFTAEGYRAFNDKLEASLKCAPKRPGAMLMEEARNHLRRARRARFDASRSVDALHDAVASMVAAFEAGQ